VNGKVERRTVLRFHPRIAPVKVGVFPLLKNKPELVAKAREVYDSAQAPDELLSTTRAATSAAATRARTKRARPLA
jgi:glycyl-tRNA synthetase (class II)